MSLRSEVVRIFNELLAGAKKISELPAASSVDAADLVEISQGGVSKKATASQFGGGGGGSVDSVTGDGVNNTDPDNPVISYPSPGDIGAATTGSVTTVATDLSNHIADDTDAHDASAISFAASGDISATNVQSAIVELDDEKAPLTPQPDEKTTNYQFALGDESEVIVYTDAGTATFTVPQDTFPVGTCLYVSRIVGAGLITFAEGGTTTLEDTKGDLNDAGEGTITSLYQRDTNIWQLLNGLPDSSSDTAWQLTGDSTLVPTTRIIGSPTLVGAWDIERDNIGVTVTDGLILENNTAAALNAQQASPALRWKGFGWKSDATTASRSVEFRIYVLPQQSAVNPIGIWSLQSSVNGAAFANCVTVNNAGNTSISGLLIVTQALGSGQKLISLVGSVEQFAVTQEGLVTLATTGSGLRIKEGSNASMGVATLVGGTVTVNNTRVTANSRIFLTVQAPGGTQGFLSHTISAATSFTVNSTSGTDTSTVNWLIIEPAP